MPPASWYTFLPAVIRRAPPRAPRCGERHEGGAPGGQGVRHMAVECPLPAAIDIGRPAPAGHDNLGLTRLTLPVLHFRAAIFKCVSMKLPIVVTSHLRHRVFRGWSGQAGLWLYPTGSGI